MAVDNDIYDRIGETWWSEDNPLNLLHGSLTPARIGYFRTILAKRGVTAGRVIDVGCGAGFMSEEMARDGYEVTGVDPSTVGIEVARRHAASQELDIDYRVGTGERLEFENASFDLALCCDVLEHVSDVDRVIAEIARVLRPGGLFFYDTVNRTRKSRIIAIEAAQEWRLTRFTDARIHEWSMFVTPDELLGALDRHGLDHLEMTGLAPRASIPALLLNLWRCTTGRISYGELSRRLDFGVVKALDVSYLGCAARRDP